MPQHSQTTLLFSAALALCTLLTTGCMGKGTGHSTRAPSKGVTSLHEDRIRTTVQTVSEQNGSIVIELPVGNNEGVEQGDFFHVFDAATKETLKGTVMVKEIIGPRRSLAQLVGGLLNQRNPLQPGDKVRYIKDISAIHGASRLNKELSREKAALDRKRQQEDKAHQKLRAHYEQQLDQLNDKHQSEVARLRQAFLRESEDMAAVHARNLHRQKAQHRAELAALGSTLTEDAKNAIRKERNAQFEDTRDLRSKNKKLALQIDRLIKEQRRYQNEVKELNTLIDQQNQRHKNEITAEIETRTILEKRIGELEKHLDGGELTISSVLSHDKNRNETVLDQLTRLQEERDRAFTLAKDLQKRLNTSEAMLLQTKERLTSIEGALAGSGSTESKEELMVLLGKQTKELEQTQRQYRALEVTQLRIEQAYYDLSARILKLPDENAAVRSLQDRLRAALKAAQNPGPQGEHK